MKQEDLQLTGGNNNKNRRELDFYPTPPEVTIALMEYFKWSPSKVWEPACGDGAIVNVIKSYGHEVVCTDLITGTDYLNTPGKADIIITNPPFNLSEQFIRKALMEADIVAMVLKSQYWHAKKRYGLFQEFKPAFVFPLTWRPDFMAGERGGSPTMEVIWTVWRKGDYGCRYIPLLKPSTNIQLSFADF